MAAQKNDNKAVILEEALTRFVDECLKGEKPDIDEFARQYPQCEAQLKVRIRDLNEIDFLFDSLIRFDETEFGVTAALQDLVGQKLASFNVEQVIGQGGMGVIYLARDTKLDRHVAIKSMPIGLLNSSKAQIRFKHEAKLLASLNHPNIAVIHDIIERKESANYLVLEYVPGETLAEKISREPLKLEEALLIGGQIAEAVSAAHKKGIIHRDLKPGNIKITPEGRVKVLDFGLAKTYDKSSNGSETAVTQTGRVIGTPAYMSPEQAQGKDTNHRTDIWSFGCIMFEMLTGRHPFECETAKDTLQNIIKHQLDWNLLPENIPSNIRTLLRRCLEKNPNQRLDNIEGAVIEINETLNKPQTTLTSKLLKAVTIFSAIILIILFAIASRFVPNKHAISSSKEIRLVVLPFENLGTDEDEYFSDGITDEITARLASVHGLGVISRQSAIQYKKSGKNTRQIAKELGVDYILEGTIQRERPSDPNSQVRIRPQLIKASDDTHVWAQTYDNDMSEIFQLQSDIAEQVAQGLNIVLLEPERRALVSRPTENMDAYDYYLRGNDYIHRSYLDNNFWNLRIAMQMFKKAIELDPSFALAYARLSQVHSRMYHFYYDRSEECLAMAKEAVDKASQLNSNLPEVHLALGHYYYHGHLDYECALEHFDIARKSQPNNSELLNLIGAAQRRQGKFEQAQVSQKRASELDPISVKLMIEVATTSLYLRKYPEAEHYYDRAISLAPDKASSYTDKAWLYLYSEGSTEKARAVLTKALDNIKSAENPFDVPLFTFDVFDGNYQEALERLSSSLKPEMNNPIYFIPKALPYAFIYKCMKKEETAEKYYDEARIILESKIQQHPEDERFHSSLGIAYAGLGRKEDAIREGKLAVELLPVGKDAVRGLFRVENLAQIYVMVGEFDAAINQLEFLLSNPGRMSIPFLQLDPIWNSLRDHPRFKKLFETDR